MVGIADGGEDIFFRHGVEGGEGFHQLFDLLALGDAVLGAGVFDDGDFQPLDGGDDFFLREIDKWADQRNILAGEVGHGGKYA